MLTADTPRVRMTLEAFLALPDDDAVERMLIDGEVWEYPTPEGSWRRGVAMVKVGRFLCDWTDAQPEPRGVVLGGRVGVVFSRLQFFGVDVAYASADIVARQNDAISQWLVGAPELAVEISRPGDIMKRRDARLRASLKAGVKLVWLLDTELRMVTAVRPNGTVEAFSGRQPVTAPDVLPGFSVPAADLFG